MPFPETAWRWLLPALGLAAGLVPGLAAANTVDAQHAGEGAALWVSECSACHELSAEAPPGIGPHLAGLLGRAAATAEGFAYSPALLEAGAAGLVWDLPELDALIENPAQILPGARMGYPGLPDATERAALLAYLEAHTDRVPPDAEAAPEIDLPAEVLALEGDREWGEYLAAECTTCHRRDGAAQGIPSITNWPEARFVTVMHAYRAGLRPHTGMQTIARRLSDEDIAALATYFATIDN
ncbi:MAG: c-type cytochrome [Pararhodobacter sp.]